MKSNWGNTDKIESKPFKCSYCGENISSDKGFKRYSPDGHIYICHHCDNPTYFDNQNKQYPGAKYGEDVKGIKDSIKQLYDEARNCMSTSSYTAVTMCCRKLLMNVAVDLGDAPGKKYVEYVDYLSNNNYIGKNSKDWIDQIRTIGNEANHEIAIKTKEEAECILQFVEIMLRIIYETSHRAKQLVKPAK